MDTSVTIIGLVIILIIAIPLYFAMRSQRMNKEKINKIFREFSQGNRFKFEIQDIHNKKTLALDTANKGLLIIDFSLDQETSYFIDLNDVQSCKIVETKSNDFEADIVKLDFEFTFKNAAQKKELIPFYDAKNQRLGMTFVYEEMQFATKWQKLIDSCI